MRQKAHSNKIFDLRGCHSNLSQALVDIFLAIRVKLERKHVEWLRLLTPMERVVNSRKDDVVKEKRKKHPDGATFIMKT